MNMEITKGQLESQAMQQRDKAEIRELLRVLIESTQSMKDLLNLKSSANSHPVEAIMGSLQTVFDFQNVLFGWSYFTLPFQGTPGPIS